MSNTTIQTDEDLIIIGDATSSDTSLLDFSFGEVKTEVPVEPVMSFDVPSSQESSISFDLDLGTSAVSATSVDTLFADETQSTHSTNGDDIFNFDTPASAEKVDIDLFAETPASTSSDIDLFGGEVIADVSEVETSSIAPVESMEIMEAPVSFSQGANETIMPEMEPAVVSSLSRNDILQDAIDKMQARKEIIAGDKGTKQSKVDELNEQIKKLKKEVADFETQIKELEKENSAIDGDIESIEKMKSTVLDVGERTRVHNLNTIKKK